MKLTKRTKIGIATVGVVALQAGALWALYTYGYSDGFRDGRYGYMKMPATNGTITVDPNKGTAKFTPYSNEPGFDSSGPWNSKANREYVEDQVKNHMGTTQYGQWVKTRVASAKCSATKTANRWYCSYRVLSETTDRSQTLEVNPITGDWQGREG